MEWMLDRWFGWFNMVQRHGLARLSTYVVTLIVNDIFLRKNTCFAFVCFFFWLELILADLLKVFMCETRTE